MVEAAYLHAPQAGRARKAGSAVATAGASRCRCNEAVAAETAASTRHPSPPRNKNGDTAVAGDDSSDDEFDEAQLERQLLALKAEDEAVRRAEAGEELEPISKPSSNSNSSSNATAATRGGKRAAEPIQFRSSIAAEAAAAGCCGSSPSSSTVTAAKKPSSSNLDSPQGPRVDLNYKFTPPRETTEPFMGERRHYTIWSNATNQRSNGAGSSSASGGGESYDRLLAQAFCGDTLSCLCSLVGLRRFHTLGLVCTSWHDAILSKMRNGEY